MGDVFQRNSMMLGAPQAAPISFGQYGLPRPDISQTSAMNTAGGLPLPDLGQGPAQPAQNFLSDRELSALGFPPVGQRNLYDLTAVNPTWTTGIFGKFAVPRYLSGQWTPSSPTDMNIRGGGS